MKINFKNLEDYLAEYGYPHNEMMKFDSFEIPDKTSYRYLMDNIKKYGDVDAITFFGRKIKYEDFAEEIGKTSKGMKGIGLSSGDRIATLIPNIPEAAYLQYGTSKIGSVPSNIDPRTNGKMLLNYIKNEKIKNIVIVDVMYESAIRPIEHQLKEEYGIDKIIVVPAINSLPLVLKKAFLLSNKIKGITPIKSDVLDIIYWDEMINNTKMENASEIDFIPNSEAVIQHSSGTTRGMPKSIPLTNENINSFVEKHLPTIFSSFPYGTKMLNILPYFASYGAINTSHLGFNLGLTLQDIPEFNFSDFGYIASKQKSEILIGTPTWFSLASKDNRLKKDALKYVKMAISGGDSIDAKTKIEVNKFLKSHGANCGITNGHGMSELSGSGSYQFSNHENDLGVGISFPYDKYIILDSNHNIVPLKNDGAKGCAWIYSPSATNGVFEGNRFIETKEINGFNFINSKDTMIISPNNEITYVEREDRTFARFDGHKIVPYDIEKRFTDNEEVNQCIIVPYEDDTINGKMPIAYITTIKELTAEEKSQLIFDIVDEMVKSENTNDRDIPRKVCFLKEMPINAMSKNDFRTLTNRELDGTEYTIDIEETNLTSGNVNIVLPEGNKVKLLKL